MDHPIYLKIPIMTLFKKNKFKKLLRFIKKSDLINGLFIQIKISNIRFRFNVFLANKYNIE